jgi:hypothetical protein
VVSSSFVIINLGITIIVIVIIVIVFCFASSIIFHVSDLNDKLILNCLHSSCVCVCANFYIR